MKKTPMYLVKLMLLVAMQACCVNVFGQSYYSKEQSGQGYWQVYTDYKTKNTVVRFFDASHQPIYQETIPRKYIKLTKKNIRKFDGVLSQLMSRNLLKSSIKSYDLVADSRTDFRDVYRPETGVKTEVKTVATAEPMGLVHNVYVTRQGKIKVILKNPLHDHVLINIVDDQLRRVYSEHINDLTYGRWFDVSKLAEGTYSLHIYSRRKTMNYKLTVDDYLGYKLEDL